MSDIPSNETIARMLEQTASLLEIKEESRYRVRAFRQAAQTVGSTDTPVGELAKNDGRRLRRLPGVGDKIAGAIEEYVDTGRFGLLEHLQSEVAPEQVFEKVPGVGGDLARRIHESLDISSLEELELAAHDGRLEGVAGIGKGRAEGIKQALAGMLSRSAHQRAEQMRHIQEQARRGEAPDIPEEPDVGLLLDIDKEYRGGAEAGRLPTITPRRCAFVLDNPTCAGEPGGKQLTSPTNHNCSCSIRLPSGYPQPTRSTASRRSSRISHARGSVRRCGLGESCVTACPA